MRAFGKSVRSTAKKVLLFALIAAPKPLFQAPSLSGVVEDETKQPVASAQVTLHSGAGMQRTSTYDLGRFRFDSISPGEYRLDFDKAGFFWLSDYPVTVS